MLGNVFGLRALFSSMLPFLYLDPIYSVVPPPMGLHCHQYAETRGEQTTKKAHPLLKTLDPKMAHITFTSFNAMMNYAVATTHTNKEGSRVRQYNTWFSRYHLVTTL